MPAVPEHPVLARTLSDGRPILLRPVRPEDRTRLAEGFEQLSEDSRRLRFIGAVQRLSAPQLDYLTRVDGENHVAWGAVDPARPGAPGLGIARFIRLPDQADVAEFSLTVVDEVQGLGLGRLLFAVLYALAPTVGVRALRGVVARENERMAGWLHRLGATVVEEGSEVVFDLPVSEDLAALPETPTARAFRADVEAVRDEVTRDA